MSCPQPWNEHKHICLPNSTSNWFRLRDLPVTNDDTLNWLHTPNYELTILSALQTTLTAWIQDVQRKSFTPWIILVGDTAICRVDCSGGFLRWNRRLLTLHLSTSRTPPAWWSANLLGKPMLSTGCFVFCRSQRYLSWDCFVISIELELNCEMAKLLVEFHEKMVIHLNVFAYLPLRKQHELSSYYSHADKRLIAFTRFFYFNFCISIRIPGKLQRFIEDNRYGNKHGEGVSGIFYMSIFYAANWQPWKWSHLMLTILSDNCSSSCSGLFVSQYINFNFSFQHLFFLELRNLIFTFASINPGICTKEISIRIPKQESIPSFNTVLIRWFHIEHSPLIRRQSSMGNPQRLFLMIFCKFRGAAK